MTLYWANTIIMIFSIGTLGYNEIQMILPIETSRYNKWIHFKVTIIQQIWQYELQISSGIEQGWHGGRASSYQVLQWCIHWLCGGKAFRVQLWEGEGKESYTNTWIGAFKYHWSYSHSPIWRIKVCSHFHTLFLKVLVGLFPKDQIWSLWDSQDLEGPCLESKWEQNKNSTN